MNSDTAEDIWRKYPVFMAPDGKKYTMIGWAVSMCSGTEWYAFESRDDGLYFGIVHGPDECEMRVFSVDEIGDAGGELCTDPETLCDLLPPDIEGWRMYAAPCPCTVM